MMKNEAIFKLKGHLKIIEIFKGIPKVIWDRHNLIVTEGKGALMDYLASDGVAPSYTPNPFTAIALTKRDTAEAAADTFLNAVFDPLATDYLSDEGVLHVPTYTSTTHVEGTSTIFLSGTISQDYGNDPINNHIKSVCLVMGTDSTKGGPGQSGYVQTGNEKLFARVHVGDLIKTIDKSYTFQWSLSVTSS